jgi:hypothetical protein
MGKQKIYVTENQKKRIKQAFLREDLDDIREHLINYSDGFIDAMDEIKEEVGGEDVVEMGGVEVGDSGHVTFYVGIEFDGKLSAQEKIVSYVREMAKEKFDRKVFAYLDDNKDFDTVAIKFSQ